MATENSAENELIAEVGRLTREHAERSETEIGWLENGRLIATEEFLSGISDAELGEIVLNKAENLLAQHIAAQG